MKQRVLDPNHYSHDLYKDVNIHPPWLNFDQFAEDIIRDIGDHPGPGYTLGRVAPFADYAPGEVDWQTYEEQNSWNPYQGHDLIEVDGVERTKEEWAEHIGISYKTLLERLRKGWGLEAYRTPRGKRPRIGYTMIEVEEAEGATQRDDD
ncbi:MAG: hypothetical protein ACWGQW_03685 [bacterium]